ncbi:MAG: isoprenyl transferase [Oscillospiraceae bacterium]
MGLDKNLVIPKHIGIIMDGNGRWAKKKMLPRTLGHKQGAKTFRTIVEYCRDIGVQYVTAYAFSTENWKRPEIEIKGIVKILKDYLIDSFSYEEEKVKVKFIGDITPLPQDIKDLIVKVEESSSTGNYRLTLNIAFNYGGRRELTKAFKDIIIDLQDDKIMLDEINEEMISRYLYTKNQPDPDFILRPSGEFRLSNFMIWQSAYSEFIFMDVLWPDFTTKDMDQTILEFNRRSRRFGGI